MDTGVLSDFSDKTGWYHHLNYLKRCRAMSNNIEKKNMHRASRNWDKKREYAKEFGSNTHTHKLKCGTKS